MTTLAGLSACSREKLEADFYRPAPQSELDRWIIDEITVPYGIEVVYRWDKKHAQEGSYAYPPEPAKVQGVLRTIKALWLEVYGDESLGGASFWRERAPVRIVIYGGPNIDTDGHIHVASTQSAARQMYIYDANSFDPKSPQKVRELMRSVHHQYALILTEIWPYDRVAFGRISEAGYIKTLSEEYLRPITALLPGYFPQAKTGKAIGRFGYFDSREECVQAQTDAGVPEADYYVNFSLKGALKQGFYTYHSRLSPESDFAEIVSIYLTCSRRMLDAAMAECLAINTAASPEEQAQEKVMSERVAAQLRAKASIVEEYFKRSVGFDLGHVQLVSLQKISKFLS